MNIGSEDRGSNMKSGKAYVRHVNPDTAYVGAASWANEQTGTARRTVNVARKGMVSGNLDHSTVKAGKVYALRNSALSSIRRHKDDSSP